MNPSDAAYVAVFLKRQIESGTGSPESVDSVQRVVDHLTAQITRMTQPLFNPAAFPRDHAQDGHNGMDLRDYFAAKAMAAHVMRHPVDAGGTDYPFDATMAEWAYAQADAMLKERDK